MNVIKKLLFLLIVTIVIPITNVEAINYSDYSDWSEWRTEKIESDELTDVKVERRYLFYKFNQVYGDYLSKANNKFPYLDLEDYVYSDFSDWSQSKPNEIENRIIEEKELYRYRKYGTIEFVKINATNQDLQINEFKIFSKGKEVSYTIDQGDLSLVKQNKKIELKLNEKIEYKDLYFSFNGANVNGEKYTVAITFSSSDKDYIEITTQGNNNKDVSLQLNFFPPERYDYLEVETKLEASPNYDFLFEVPIYRYKDKLYHSYKLDRDYYSEYLSEAFESYIFKDENNYKDYYSYRTRTIIHEEDISESDEVELPNSNKINQDKNNKEEKSKIAKEKQETSITAITDINSNLSLENDNVVKKNINETKSGVILVTGNISVGDEQTDSKETDKQCEKQISSLAFFIATIPFLIISLLLLLLLFKKKKKKEEE